MRPISSNFDEKLLISNLIGGKVPLWENVPGTYFT
jgi:hypothetical protein